MKPKVFSLRLLVTLIAWLALLVPTAKLKADNSPLCFTAKNGSVTVRFNIQNVTHQIQYSTNGTSWNNYTSNTGVTLNANGSVYFRAKTNQTVATAFGSSSFNNSMFSFSSTNSGIVEASGNIMSLYGPNCPNLQLPQYAFTMLFNGCTLLATAPELPATSLGEWCYAWMFSGCTSLARAPELPATVMTNSCYRDMFSGCSSLTYASDLPAMTLAYNCYGAMYANCSSLTRIPELPATVLSEACYGTMFGGCTSLTTIPSLPATTLTSRCYEMMFWACTSLSVNTSGSGKPWIIPSTSIPTGALDGMFSGTSGTMNSTPSVNTTYYIASDTSYHPVADTVDYLCFTARNGSVTVKFHIYSLFGAVHNIQYSLDATSWNDYVSDSAITLNADDKIYFREQTDQTTAQAFGYVWADYSSVFDFSSDDGGTVQGSGNIMSLYGPSCPNLQLPQYAFAFMFSNCTLLTQTPRLPATALGKQCYNEMFSGCTSLTNAPALPATTLAERCYYNMFQGCTSLTSAPALPATTLANYCCFGMFANCTSLTTAPALNCTNLMYGCYWKMFYNCTALVSAPRLPATTVAKYCYDAMFEGCTSLTTAPALPAGTMQEHCYENMFRKCTSLTTAPSLPAITLAFQCYYQMFDSCTSLTVAPSLPATVLDKDCYESMFSNCTSLTAAPSLPAGTMAYSCYNNMFKNCKSLVAAPALPATTLAYACYSSMFSGCTSLVTAPALPATTLVLHCYSNMFKGCTSLASVPTLPATSLADQCYYNMFFDCTSLTTIPTLPATTTANECYTGMFDGCKSLVINTTGPGKAWEIPIATAPQADFANMFSGTSGTMNCTPSANTEYYIASDFSNPLCFTARNGSVIVSFDIKNVTHTIQYSKNGTNWWTYSSGRQITLNADESLYLRASTNQSTATAFGTSLSQSSSKFTFSSANGGTVEASGNIMSLYRRDCMNIPLQQYAFANMFDGCDILISTPMMPATTLANHCYRNMFNGCTSLAFVSQLPATALASGCYQNMFYGCTSLSALPELPSLSLADSCYKGMFSGCTSLITLPLLSATTLPQSCYEDMFKNCTSLAVNHVGPGYEWKASAITSMPNALSAMFDGTSGSMNGTPSANTSYYIASDSLRYPLCFTARNGDVTVAFDIKNVTHTIRYSTDGTNWNDYTSNTDLTVNADGKIYFCAKDIQNASLSFGSQPQYSYYTINPSRFYFSSVNGGTVEASGNILSLYSQDCRNTRLPDAAFANMFYECKLLTKAPLLPASYLSSSCFSSLFYGCTSLTEAPALPATALESSCYQNMFKGCSSLKTAPELPATQMTSGCYSGMFAGCSSLTAAPTLPATNMVSGCYQGMFSGCTSLAAAPTLPATITAQYCYKEMFSGCTSLTSVPELPAPILSYGCYANMFSGCANLKVNISGPGKKWQITSTGSTAYSSSTPSNEVEGMFSGTIGTMNGTPAVNTTYYIASDLTNPLCFTARNGGVSVSFDIKNVTHTIQYSTNDSIWNTYTSGTQISLNTDESLYFRAAVNQTAASAFGSFSSLNSSKFTFTSSNGGTVEASGNIMSLYSPDCNDIALPDFAFANMFDGCSLLSVAPKLSATTLANRCYYKMFSDCSSLSSTPALPATNLASGCYQSMFEGCSSLTTLAKLPATALADSCYMSMFEDCSSLVTVPQLPATALTNACYKKMFYDCSSLIVDTVGPGYEWHIPASTTVPDALTSMFTGTTGTMNGTPSVSTSYFIASDSLRYPLCFTARNGNVTVAFDIKNVTHTILYSTDGFNWSNYTPNTDVALSANGNVFFRAEEDQTVGTAFGTEYSWYGEDFSKFIFLSSDGGTVEASGSIMSLYGPNCPDIQLPDYAFASLFSGCTLLTTAPLLPATFLSEGCYSSMFSNCTSLVAAPELPAMSLASECYSSMFSNCTSLVAAPELPAMNLASECYSSMFSNCNSLTAAPELPAMNLASYCYSSMFSNCTSLVAAPELPAMSLASNCYYNMFSGCTSLVFAPELPATNLARQCYGWMFSHCSSLISIPTLPATTLTDYCYWYMFCYCTSLKVNTTAPGKQWKITASSTPSYSLNDMFSGTSGTMNGTPTINTTYYIASDTIPARHTVIVNVNNPAMGRATGGGTFNHGQLATLVATPNAHYHFVSWSNGLTTPSITMSVVSDTTLTAIFAINPTYHFTDSQTICQGESYNWRSRVLTTSGTYYDSLKSVLGEDSVYELNLTVTPSYFISETMSIIRGSSYAWRGRVLTASGVYYDSLTTVAGCDSVYQLNLSVVSATPAVENLSVSNVMTNSFRITWTKAATGTESMWQVEVKKSDGTVVVEKATMRLYYDVTVLTPSTAYTVIVRPRYNSKSFGDTATTNATTIAAPAVENLTVSNITLNSFRISWSKDSAGTESMWQVEVKRPDGTVVVNKPTQRLYYDATGLTAATTYTIIVRPRYSSRHFGDTATTNATTIGMPAVENLTVSSVTQNSFHITWTKAAAGTESMWQIEVKKPDGTVIVNKPTTRLYYDATGLTEATTYTINVRPRYSSKSFGDIATTTATTAAVPTPAVENLTVSNVTTKSFHITWTKSATGTESMWQVEVKKSDGTVIVNKPTTRLYYDATGLTASTEYIVTVRPRYSSKSFGDAAQVSQTTLAAQNAPDNNDNNGYDNNDNNGYDSETVEAIADDNLTNETFTPAEAYVNFDRLYIENIVAGSYVTIVDAAGKTICNEKVNDTRFEYGLYVRGIYTVVIRDAEHNQTLKVVY